MVTTDTPAGPRRPEAWPLLPAATWQDTGATLHMWLQVVGKVRLALSPPENHYWHSALYVTARGLTTSPIPSGTEAFQVDLDFVAHRLRVATSWGEERTLALAPRSVADFYHELMAALRALGIEVSIWTMPVEVADPIPFDEDRVHAAYDADAAHSFWRILLQTDRVFKRFRGRFVGKCSPVHLFWGGLDLAVTRFSGRRAPLYTGVLAPNVNPHVMHESYSHEVLSAGFWPGAPGVPPAFYAYAVPQPAGFAEAAVRPAAATYNAQLGEFLLPYEVVRSAANPDEVLLDFLQSTYVAGAELGGWDRALLEERPPCTCDPPPVWPT